MPTSNQEPQPQDMTPKRDRRTMQRIRARGQEARGRIGEGEGGMKKLKQSKKSYRLDVENLG